MALSQKVVYDDAATEASVNLDPSIVPFNASVVVTLGSTGDYKLQFSLDDITTADADSIWTDSVNIPSGTTASAVTNFMFPVSKIRLVIAANGSTITLQVLQGFTTN